MAFLDSIRNFFIPTETRAFEIVVPAPLMNYEIRPLTVNHQKEVLELNLRCFSNGENYTKHTFAYLLNDSNTLSYRIVAPNDKMVGFVFIITDEKGAGHITTIGIAPEHRRRGLAEKLLTHTEKALQKREINTLMLEVRVSNIAAQSLYRGLGYLIVQRIHKYYNNGEDCFLMVKSIY